MDVATLRAAMEPTSVSDDTLTDYLPYFMAAMEAAGINTVNRAAAWCSQIGHESAGLRYMAEIQTSDQSWSTDRTRYRGRGPIQLTWSSNYRKFGQWCASNGWFVNDPELFVKQPELVEEPKWGFLAASWYWLNAGPRPGRINEYADARDILAVSRCVNGWVEGRQPNGYADRCARWNRCLALGDQLLTGGSVPAPSNRPDFNEYANWTKNNESRGGTKVDLWLIHTQEAGGGDNAADDLSRFIRSTEGSPNPRSYHYCISQASDGGVTVVDCVDTDFAAWAVGNSNDRSINLCFAGSKVAWSREQWLTQGKAIDVAAYIAVQDCRKYGVPLKVIPPPYASGPPGIADHKFCKEKLHDGNDHTDVGDNFPWDVFGTAVNKYATGQAPDAPPVVVERLPQDLTDRKLWEDVWVQLRGPDGKGWPQLGQNADGHNLTLVDAVAKLMKQ
jgi:predicted chitinase